MHKAAVLTGRRGGRGFSLIEAMIALFVFALVITIFSSALIVAKSASTINGEYAQAISLSQHKIDQLRAVGFGRLTYTELSDAEIIDLTPNASPYSFKVVDDVANYLPGAAAGQGPTATLKIENHATDTRIKKVTVTITWRSSPRRSSDSTVSEVAYIANAD